MTIRFVTTNPGKVREAREYLAEPVEQLDFDTPEIQSADLGAIAAHKARAAYEYADEPVFVDDAGLFIEAFDGFPGPYSSYVHDTVGVERVWRLASEEDDRAASFRGVVAYCDGGEFEATPEPVDREARRGQDLSVEERAAATTDEQVRAGDGSDSDSDGLPVKLFYGVVPGEIVEPRGTGGFGYDPIFEYDDRTFAEMDAEEKNAISHRGRALAKFAEWLDGRTA
ncbi:non-canonical purine NTP pyrophosphatase [Halosimplex amylolyticum]|uniref:non-canonical purine NTP pyrophosphatase n=1 Tax=Halosimplex amylolyticum TaxID=3396616 RepID=UPI003F54F523